MRKILYILFISTVAVSAQTANQLDEDGKRHGVWSVKYKGTEVKRFEGKYEHGKEVGLFKFYKNQDDKPVLFGTKMFYLDSPVIELTFLNGKGGVVSKGMMKEKKYVGIWKYYHKKSDKIMTLENYNSEGELHGERIVYFKDEVIAEKATYKNGKLEGKMYSYFENGKPRHVLIYVNDELHGLAKYYASSGGLVTEGYYKNGKKEGVWKYYSGGKVKEEKDFSYKRRAELEKARKEKKEKELIQKSKEDMLRKKMMAR